MARREIKIVSTETHDTPAPAPAEEAPAPDLLAQIAAKPKGIASAADLKGGQVTLPSGVIVKIRRAQLLSLAAAGHIPNPLLPVAVRAAKSTEVALKDDYDDLPEAERAERKAQDEVDQQKLIDAVVCAVVSEPKIVATEAEETEDSVWVGSLWSMDKQAIYYYAQYPQSYWDNFRSQQ